MSARAANIGRGLALALASAAAIAHAQAPDSLAAAAAAPAVELPPLVVEESAVATPWLYARVNGTEYLSRCSESTTRRYAEAWEHALHFLWTILPDSLLARGDLPAITVLYSQKLSQTTSPELLRALKEQRAPVDRPGVPDFARDTFYRFAPNMRLNDRDLYVTFAYIEETNFDASHLSAAPEYLRFLLERRVPALPAWFIEGIDQLYRHTILGSDAVILSQFFWLDWVQTRDLAGNPGHPRALLPASELFAPDALRGPINGNPRRAAILQAEAALFIRWALTTGPANRDALWQFAARAAEVPVTEALFTSYFGIGYSELRDRLSDYLPQALQDAPRLEPGKFPRGPRIAVRIATAGEVARLRGEWERLATGFVQKGMPQLREHYVEQARRTVHRAFDAGDRDPQLLATMGLGELAAGMTGAAQLFLDAATAAGVVRPRAYYEVARLRFTELRRSDTRPADPAAGHGEQAAARLFSPPELAPVLAPLRIAARQRPLLPETFALLASALLCSRAPPSPEDFALLEAGARLFARRPEVNLQLALALARHGRKDSAAALLAAGIDYATDDAMRARFVEVRASLASPR